MDTISPQSRERAAPQPPAPVLTDKGEQIPEIARQLQEKGHRPYLVPYGGSDTTGALGFVAAVAELVIQQQALEQPISHIVFASSSGGTPALFPYAGQRLPGEFANAQNGAKIAPLQ